MIHNIYFPKLIATLFWGNIFLLVKIGTNYYPWPIPSMYGIFIYIFHKKSTIHVGTYTSPMDGKGRIFKRETSARKAEAPCADTVGWQGNAIT